ncbi:hypothetical protein QQ008_07575 [Fulvivirgaceae bacterium BMA10]|uniref:Tetratricopeptide repeat protein n=1 Tax=Splendidivirga corallicola TaxID=3051826 RepID=A0ABT8KKH6_9BACT|nr:hypothetical protein [Fulvivirgaceae bacterium BMA10]
MNLDFIFKSSDHLRYENGQLVAGLSGGANRALKVEPDIQGREGYTVTLYNLDGNHPFWQNNVQMSPKPMRIIEQTSEKIVLRGYGHDIMGESFEDYGLTIQIEENSIEKCILHMHDRNVDIEYKKAEDQFIADSNTEKDDFQEIRNFVQKWTSQWPMDIKMSIASKTDELNNIGADFYGRDDITNAIRYFNQALDIMPINDDALKNLVICYRLTNDQQKLFETEKKLEFLKQLGV